MVGLLTDSLAWITVSLLGIGVMLARRQRSAGHPVLTLAWMGFGLFWILLIPHYTLDENNFILGLGCALGAACCFQVARIFQMGPSPGQGPLALSRAVAFMGLIYLPFVTFVPLRRFLVESLTAQFELVLMSLGYQPEITTAKQTGFQSAYVFTDGSGHRYRNHLVLGCTGLGSIAFMIGSIGTLKVPLRRRLRLLLLIVPCLWLLNLLRNVFIAVAFGKQWFQVFVDPVMTVAGYSDPGLVSYFIADRIIAQSASVIVMIVLVWLVARSTPKFRAELQDILRTLRMPLRESEIATL